MADKTGLKVILGAGNVGDSTIDIMVRFDAPEQVNALLDTFYNRGYRQLDTARGYSVHAPGTSELRLGTAEAWKRFIIDTKVKSTFEGAHSSAGIKESVEESLSALKAPSVNVEYLHSPDRSTPFEETCEAINKAFHEGKFKEFGLSNYTAAEVEQILEICDRRNFIKPTVYQGQYNPIVRSGEAELFPVLRKHNIAFYSWSPAAGGFFTGKHKNPAPGSRYDPSHWLGQFYIKLYSKPEVVAAADRVSDLAAKHGISGHAAALRWTAFHSSLDPKFNDGIVIGASSIEQLQSNLDMIEQGPLPEDLATAIGQVYSQLGDEKIAYHR